MSRVKGIFHPKGLTFFGKLGAIVFAVAGLNPVRAMIFFLNNLAGFGKGDALVDLGWS